MKVWQRFKKCKQIEKFLTSSTKSDNIVAIHGLFELKMMCIEQGSNPNHVLSQKEEGWLRYFRILIDICIKDSKRQIHRTAGDSQIQEKRST